MCNLMLNSILDIQAKESLPEIRELFATGLVDLGACGDYAEVSRLIDDPNEKGDPNSCITEIHERFADMKRRWDR